MSHGTTSTSLPARDDLTDLLAAEQRLERLVKEAQAEASRIVAAATTAAADSERELAAELEREATELALRLEAEATRRQADILAEGEALASRFDSVSADRIAVIARRIIDALVAAS